MQLNQETLKAVLLIMQQEPENQELGSELSEESYDYSDTDEGSD